MHAKNNFDILRLSFALVVVFAHCSQLSAQPSLEWIGRLLNSRIAVEGFFVISGYLIIGSYERSRSLTSYFQKRALRILPAYWTALLFTLIIGATLSTLPILRFVTAPDTWKYIEANLTFANFLHPSLPGLFLHNPGGPPVNGALWTIKIEILFYLLVPAIAWIAKRFGYWQTPGAIFTLSLLYREICERHHRDLLARQLPGQLCFFAIGILAFYCQEFAMRRKTTMVFITLLACLAYLTIGGIAIEAIAVPCSVLAIALLAPHVAGPTRYGDFSYGVYVFHFPIIQSLITLGLFASHPWLAIATVLLSVAVLAVASWKFIEEPCLKLRSSQPLKSAQLRTP